MALYHGGENDIEFVPSCPTSRDSSPTREDADLEGVFMGYPNISPAPFTNLVAFKRICLTHSKRLVEGTQTPQYLAFTSEGLPFEIPGEKLYDGLPENIPGGEFLFTPDYLNAFNTSIWAGFPQHQQ
ncbi:unnamed protein product [Sphagnum jensenii]